MARKPIIQVARSQYGTSEYPVGSNMGARIWKYKAATWLSPNQPWPWCVAFWQWCIKEANGKAFPYQTAAVASLASYARQHGLTTTSPKVGDAALFGGDHITFVDSIGNSGFVGIGGNQSNRVQRNNYSRSSVSTWISSEKVSRFLGAPPKKKPPRPRFEIVRGEGGQEKRVATAGNLNLAMAKARAQLQKIGKGVVQIRKNPKPKGK